MNSYENKTRVLITSTHTEAKGGIAVLHRVLFEQPIQNSFDVTIFRVSSPRYPFQEQFIRRVTRLFSCLKSLFLLLANDESIKIVHINTSTDTKALLRDVLILIISIIFKRKIILQIHSSINSSRKSKLFNLTAMHIFKRSDRILVYSKEDKQKISNLVPKEKVEIFRNAVITKEFLTDNESIKNKLSIPDKSKIVLYIGRLVKEKGLYDLIESIPIVLKEFEPAYFVFAGEGLDKDHMENICNERGIKENVRFTGHIDNRNIARVLFNADIFVLPTYSEGMPMVILEALAAGLPIITTPVGAIPDIIKDGINGFLVEPRSPRQLAEKILFLLNRDDIRNSIRETNIQLAKKEFDVKVVLDKLEQLYLSI
jgi:glycosyltransferase involved in cell wall biosynthesis